MPLSLYTEPADATDAGSTLASAIINSRKNRDTIQYQQAKLALDAALGQSQMGLNRAQADYHTAQANQINTLLQQTAQDREDEARQRNAIQSGINALILGNANNPSASEGEIQANRTKIASGLSNIGQLSKNPAADLPNLASIAAIVQNGLMQNPEMARLIATGAKYSPTVLGPNQQVMTDASSGETTGMGSVVASPGTAVVTDPSKNEDYYNPALRNDQLLRGLGGPAAAVINQAGLGNIDPTQPKTMQDVAGQFILSAVTNQLANPTPAQGGGMIRTPSGQAMPAVRPTAPSTNAPVVPGKTQLKTAAPMTKETMQGFLLKAGYDKTKPSKDQAAVIQRAKALAQQAGFKVD